METLHRSFLLEDLLVRANEDGTPSNIFDLSASSEFPVNRGRYTEILDHGPNSMRSTASSLLFNHNPDYLMGAVRSLASSGKRTSQASVEILPGATLPSGVSALDAVRSGALKGVSIGYRINAHTRTEDKAGNITIRATDWTINEISLTPIPADPTVGLGRSSDPDGAAFAALFDSESQQKDRAQMADPIIPALAPVAVPQTDFRAEAKTIATQAEALGLRSADFVGLPAHEAQTAMLNAVAASRKADPVMKPSAIVTADSDEKMVRHCLDLVKDGEFKRAVNIFNQRNGGQSLEGEALVNAVSRGFSPGRDSGLFDMGAVKRSMKAGKWNDALDADAVRAALVSSSFTMIAGLASAKLAFDGFTSYVPWSDAVIDRMSTGDFKAARTASMQLSDFSSPAEGSAFSDMTVGDAGGTNSLTMRGSGIELTKQAIYNDETGTFLKTIFKVGYMGAQHQDKLVATTVEATNFTAATVGNAFSQANMKTSWTNMMAVTGPAGEKPGYIPRKILVPTALYLTAVEATTVVGGSTIASPLAKDVALGNKFAMEVVHGLHLSSGTSWYMLADNVMNPAWTFLTHSEYPIPQIFEVDSGLVASRKFRVEYPSAVITNHLNPGTNTKPVGAYKNT